MKVDPTLLTKALGRPFIFARSARRSNKGRKPTMPQIVPPTTSMQQKQRKLSATIQPNLRTKEWLHRRIVKAAKERGVSLNREMNDRLAASFEQETLRSLDAIAADLRKACDRLTA
jgi:hypothetical protein